MLKVGFAEVDITPADSQLLAGYFNPRPSTGALDPLYARAVVFDDGTRRAGVVVLDSIGVWRHDSSAIRAAIDFDDVFISATHTHTAPSPVCIFYSGDSRNYIEGVLRPDGVYAINVIDGPRQRFLQAETATLASVFDHVAVLLGPGAAAGGRGNSVIVATNGDLDTDLLGRLAERDRGGIVADIAAFTSGASVLTDDFAPVDQLLAGGA